MCALGLGFLGRKGKRYGDLFSRTGKWKHSSFDIVQAAKERTKTRFSWPTPSRQKHWTKNNVRYITHCVVTFEASTKSNTLYKPGVKILLPVVEYISPGGLSTQGISTQKQHSFELHRNYRCLPLLSRTKCQITLFVNRREFHRILHPHIIPNYGLIP